MHRLPIDFLLAALAAIARNNSLPTAMSESSVAVLGASRDRRKYGNKAVRAYVESGFTVFPVNPNEATIEGLKAYPSLDAIAEPIDFVSLYVPPAIGLKLLPAIAAKKPKEL